MSLLQLFSSRCCSYSYYSNASLQKQRQLLSAVSSSVVEKIGSRSSSSSLARGLPVIAGAPLQCNRRSASALQQLLSRHSYSTTLTTACATTTTTTPLHVMLLLFPPQTPAAAVPMSLCSSSSSFLTSSLRQLQLGGSNSGISIIHKILLDAVWLIKRTFQPSIIRKKRKMGFLVRQRTVGGRRTLARRRLKGRARLGGGI